MIKQLFMWMMDHVATQRDPDFVITNGEPEKPYLRRWYVIKRNPYFNIYLHQFLRSDEDEALHDHPWPNLSILLNGKYVEHTINAGGVNVRTPREPGWRSGVKFRLPWAAHRVELLDSSFRCPCVNEQPMFPEKTYALANCNICNGTGRYYLADAGEGKTKRVPGRTPLRCWTLFITGPKIRKWGFHCPKGWVDFDKFYSETDSQGRTAGQRLGCDQA